MSDMKDIEKQVNTYFNNDINDDYDLGNTPEVMDVTEENALILLNLLKEKNLIVNVSFELTDPREKTFEFINKYKIKYIDGDMITLVGNDNSKLALHVNNVDGGIKIWYPSKNIVDLSFTWGSSILTISFPYKS